MKAFTLTLALLFASSATPYALANNDPKHLINSCQELLKIYENRDQQQLLAWLMTSTSEAMRGGYCRGVLDEYRRSVAYCAQSNWHAQAASIAEYSVYAEELPSVETLLRQSCDL